MSHSSLSGLLTVCIALLAQQPHCAGREDDLPKGNGGLTVVNGWYVHNAHAVWGYGQHNGWWRAGQRPNIARNAPGQVGPNRTDDLHKLTDAMLRFGYPGFEHNSGLWYDRRRDRHDTARRSEPNAIPPFLEQPWARTGPGTACDGLPKYDLTKYNEWYFKRLREFAALCDRKGTILFHNHYMQHALLETNAHYVGFPWRPTNCIRNTGMPRHIPAANTFYDVSRPMRRKLHRGYIRKCLDQLGGFRNLVFLCSEEYTGPLSFIDFWLDAIFEWEKEKRRDVHVALGACKDVIDAVLVGPRRRALISTIDLRYWWYERDGRLFAPKGGQQIAGRYTGQLRRTSPEHFYRQIREYRRRYPEKGIIHGIPGTRQHAWAALMGGASMLIGQLPYPGHKGPPRYISSANCIAIQPTYDFIHQYISTSLARMKPSHLVLDYPEHNWCLADSGRVYLVYALKGGGFRVDLSAAPGYYRARWFDPRTGRLSDAREGYVTGGGIMSFRAPDAQDWALWLMRTTSPQEAVYPKWQKIEMVLKGPDSRARGEPNPFAIRVDVTFTSPTGRKYRVPAFYNGDGRGGVDGNVWVVRFSADETGSWSFVSESANALLKGHTGSFVVCDPAEGARGFYRWGRLEAVGTPDNGIRYLKFRDGPYWLKAGCDDPENFLGRFKHYDTLAKRKAAVRYLAERGINSMYIMTHNLCGDHNDVWPWLGKTARAAKAHGRGDVRFDIARLEEWRQLFEYMQAQGVVPYLVLEDDSAWRGYDHTRYYREIIARFGDLPALIFNFNEEYNENYSLRAALDFVRLLKDIDPYDHPCGIHNVNRPNDAYIDAPQIDFTSIQTGDAKRPTAGDALKHNGLVIDWIERCRSRKRRVLMIGGRFGVRP